MRTHRVNETSSYDCQGKKVCITYVHKRDYYILSINNQLLPDFFKTKAAALQEAYRMLTNEEAADFLKENEQLFRQWQRSPFR